MTVRENDDPRSPSRQFADWMNQEYKAQNIGAVNASEILWKANIAREAFHNWDRKMPFADYLKKWLDMAKNVIE